MTRKKDISAEEKAAAEAIGLPFDKTNEKDKPARGNPNWRKGQSANPAGRPKGARSTLGQDFIKALQEDFRNGNGLEAIQRVREKRPQDYLKVLASILPKQVEVKVDRYEEMSEEDLERAYLGLLKALNSRIEAGASAGGGRARSETETERASVLSTLH